MIDAWQRRPGREAGSVPEVRVRIGAEPAFDAPASDRAFQTNFPRSLLLVIAQWLPYDAASSATIASPWGSCVRCKARLTSTPRPRPRHDHVRRSASAIGTTTPRGRREHRDDDSLEADLVAVDRQRWPDTGTR